MNRQSPIVHLSPNKTPLGTGAFYYLSHKGVQAAQFYDTSRLILNFPPYPGLTLVQKEVTQNVQGTSLSRPE